MKTKPINNKIIFTLIFILGLILILFVIKHYNLSKDFNNNVSEYNNLVEEYNTLKMNYNELKLNYDQKSTTLIEIESNLKKLEILNNSISSELSKIKTENKLITEDYEYIKNDLLNFKEIINESMDWFRENSTIESINDLNRFKLKLKTKCVYCENDYCYIKTACIEHVNSTYLKLKYKEDIRTSKEEDKLQTLESFVNNKGGDCEDFSLLFTAQLRYLVDYIKLEKEKIPIIESIIEDKTNVDYYIYGDPGEDGSWYYDKNIKGYHLDENYIHPYVVCGNLYDIQSQEYNGHCVTLVTNYEIERPEDISEKIYNSYLIEPQFGDFIDYVDYSGLLGEQNNIGEIYMIITKNDIFYNEMYLLENPINQYNWYGYQTYLEKINDIK